MLSNKQTNKQTNDHGTCIGYRYRPDGGLQAKIKVEKTGSANFLFVDDCPLNATTEANMQQRVNKFQKRPIAEAPKFKSRQRLLHSWLGDSRLAVQVNVASPTSDMSLTCQKQHRVDDLTLLCSIQSKVLHALLFGSGCPECSVRSSTAKLWSYPRTALSS